MGGGLAITLSLGLLSISQLKVVTFRRIKSVWKLNVVSVTEGMTAKCVKFLTLAVKIVILINRTNYFLSACLFLSTFGSSA
jgi:hypothetical protein